MSGPVVIIGTGQGGFQLAASLREAGHRQPITLVGEEPGLPYQRPPLSKAFLKGQVPEGGLLLRPTSFFERHDLRLLTSVRAQAVDRTAREVLLSDGRTLGYGHLVLATGTRARRLQLPGAQAPGVVTLRTKADAQALYGLLADAQRVVVIGAGFIGLELAAVACSMDRDIDVLETAARPLERALSRPMAEYLMNWHRTQGARIHCNAALSHFESDKGRVSAVHLADGTRLPADLVVLAVGVLPNDELARGAGLALENGVAVDDRLLTSDAAISALGDCASFPWRGSRVRIESVQNAVDQARHIAARLCGSDVSYDRLPWFWSEQGACRLQMAGLSRPEDETRLEGDPGSGRFSVQRWREGQLVAVESLNEPAAHMRARKVLSEPTTAAA